MTITRITLMLATLCMTACGQQPAADRPVQRLVDEVKPAGPLVDNPFGANATADADVGDNMTTVDGAAIGGNDADVAGDGAPDASTGGSYASDPVVPAALAPSPASGQSCSDGKRTCGDMSSCEDAMFHLNQCGMSRLDGDSDGTPCEKICG